MAANVKRKLFHILNERARREQREKEAREEELYNNWSRDPRRNRPYIDNMDRIYPLIEEE